MPSLERLPLIERQDENCWICLESKPDAWEKYNKNNGWLDCKCSLTAHESCLKTYLLTAIEDGRAKPLHPFFLASQSFIGDIPHQDTELMYRTENHTQSLSNRSISQNFSGINKYFLNYHEDQENVLLSLFRKGCMDYWRPSFWVKTKFHYIGCPQCRAPIVIRISERFREQLELLIEKGNLIARVGFTVAVPLYISQTAVQSVLDIFAKYGEFCMHLLIPNTVRVARLKAYKNILNGNDNLAFQRADYLIFAASSFIASAFDWNVFFFIPWFGIVYKVRQSDFWICMTEASLYFLVAHSFNGYKIMSYNSFAYMIERLIYCFCFNPIYKRLISDNSADMFTGEGITIQAPENVSYFAKIKAFCQKQASKVLEFLTTDYFPQTHNFYFGFLIELFLWPRIGCFINRNFFMHSRCAKAFLNKFSDTPDEAVLLGNMAGASVYRIGKQALICAWQYYTHNYTQESATATVNSNNMLFFKAEGYGQLFGFATSLPNSENQFPQTILFTKYFPRDLQGKGLSMGLTYTAFRKSMRSSVLYNFSRVVNSVE